MFGFRKQKQKKGATPISQIDSDLSGRIHVMPQRFYVAPKKKQTGLIIIILVGVLLIGGLIGVAFYLNENLKKNQAAVNTNQPLNTNINQAVNENTNQPLNTNINFNANTNIDINANANINVNANINTNVNINSNTNTATQAPLPSALDSDNDGLTAAEESLYGTDSNNADSDGDGYQDGAELLSGYDPTQKNQTLLGSGLFLTYNQPIYSIIYPKNWTVKEQDQAKSEVLFTASDGEFIEVLTIDNSSNLSLGDWYQREFPKNSLSQLTEVKINNLSGLRSADNQSYYFMKPDGSKIFVLIYNAGNLSELNFLATLNAMVKSFKVNP
ncbi:MAG: hypothetical protein WC508_01285 [Patescibacteria group bacterium]